MDLLPAHELFRGCFRANELVQLNNYRLQNLKYDILIEVLRHWFRESVSDGGNGVDKIN